MFRLALQKICLLLAVLLVGCAAEEDSTGDVRVIERFMATLDAQAFNDLNEILCPELVAHLAGKDLNRTEFVQMARGVYERYPDFRHEIDEVFAATDRVVLRATDFATHAETGRSVSFGQISIYRIEDGCIAEWWEEFDKFGLNEQLTRPDPEVNYE